MSLIKYIRKYGVKRTIKVIYSYKLDVFIRNIMKKLTNKMKLKNVIIIESHNDFDCNGGAFYNYLIENKYNNYYKIVWLLKNKKPDHAPMNVLYFYLRRPSFRKNYYICLAKYLLADNDITNKVKDEQLSIFLNHGAFALKNCKGLYCIPDSVDYVLSGSKNIDKYVTTDCSMEYPSKRLIHTGIPSDDIYYKNIEDEYKKISKDKYSYKVLWMPTFRKGGGYKRNDSNIEFSYGIPLIENEEIFIKLDKYLANNNILLVIKIHPMQDLDTISKLHDTKNIKILTGKKVKELNVDNYRLMSCSDALISDYSSSTYSFLVLNRPIGFVFSDLKDYKLGLSVENVDEYIVGDTIINFNDLLKFLNNIVNKNDSYIEKRSKLINILYEHCDGKSCERLANFMGLKNE